jgi:hypothetical protein
MANSGNRATPPSKQTVVATAPHPHATRRMETDGAAICSSSMSASSFRKQSGPRAGSGLVTSPPLPRGRTTRARTPVRRWRAHTRAPRRAAPRSRRPEEARRRRRPPLCAPCAQSFTASRSSRRDDDDFFTAPSPANDDVFRAISRRTPPAPSSPRRPPHAGVPGWCLRRVPGRGTRGCRGSSCTSPTRITPLV